MRPEQSIPVRVFIAGGVTSERLQNINAIQDSHTFVCGLMAYKKHLTLSAEEIGIPTWFYDTLGNGTVKSPSMQHHKDYDSCLAALLADPRTFYLIERVYGSGGYNTVFNQTLKIEIACWNSLTILSETLPDRLIFMGITHHPMSWIFGRCAELVGISTYFTNASPLPWRYWPVRGIDEQSIVDIGLGSGRIEEEAQLSKKALEFIEINTRDYAQALPSNCSEVRGREKEFWSWKSEIKLQFSWNPFVFIQNMVRMKRKRNLFIKYKQVSAAFHITKPYIVFFLHMQPEASSLPMGYSYVQQWLAIRALATALPTGWTLVIREHPYTFLWNANIESVRTMEFYESMRSLPNVALAPLEADPFDLIDECESVATLTGTVGIQSLCRGKPVIAFGSAPYLGCPGVFFVKGIEQIRAALKKIQAGKSELTTQKFYQYISWVESVSIEGVSEESCWDGNDIEIWADAKTKLWERLIKLQNDPPATMFSEHRPKSQT